MNHPLRSQVLESIRELARSHKDTSGGFEFAHILADWIKLMKSEDQEIVLSVLEYQFTWNQEFGDLYPDVLLLLKRTERAVALLSSAFYLPHVTLRRYYEILTEYSNASAAHDIVQTITPPQKSDHALVLGMLCRRGNELAIPAATSWWSICLERALYESSDTEMMDAFLFADNDFLPGDPTATVRVGTRLSSNNRALYSAFREIVAKRLNTNPILGVSCKRLRIAVDRYLIGT